METEKERSNVALYIADEAQMIGDWRMDLLTKSFSQRARFVAAQTQNETRMVTLTVPWPMHRTLEIGWVFRLQASSTSLQVQDLFNGSSYSNLQRSTFPSLMLAMAKPAYLAIVEHSTDQTSVGFRSFEKASRSHCSRSFGFVQADSERDDSVESRFLNIEQEDFETSFGSIE
ncbi:hypothetical protein L7F22_013692 [Adiantum nelumboides]|nr:hypothetical protein [Adiantum nelumboides]